MKYIERRTIAARVPAMGLKEASFIGYGQVASRTAVILHVMITSLFALVKGQGNKNSDLGTRDGP